MAPPERISASLEGLGPSSGSPLRSRPPSSRSASPAPPTGALNAPVRRGHPGQRRIPATLTPDTARESDHGAVRTVRHCTAIPDVVHVLCGMTDVIPWHYAAHSHPSSTLHPSKGDSDALKGRTTTNPAPIQDAAVTQGKRSMSSSSPLALCSHPWHCVAIPGTAEPSPTLWGLCSRDTATPVAVQPKLPLQQDPRIGVRTTTRRGHR
jgi:hypothetical protein